MTDTIFALSSGKPPAGIAVIRISGSQSFEIYRLFTGCDAESVASRTAHLRLLTHPATGEALDRGLVLLFPGPNSVTGEDLVEWHCHGGQAVVRAVLDALAEQARERHDLRLREAQPGEFTRRAFENGRIDLNEAEGLADLLTAETETQRRSAMMMAEGHFSRRLADWRATSLECSARMESLLDFSDEDDVPGEGAERALRTDIRRLAEAMAAQLALSSAERLQDGIRVVLAGPPNAGKSTLLNALVGRDAAIVSDIAGTTRDRIEVPVNIGDIAFVLTDTAGLAGETEDAIERIGINRAQAAIDACDILLWLGDPAQCPRADGIRVSAQMDRSGWVEAAAADITLSALTGENMGALRDMLIARATDLIPGDSEYALHRRQRDAVADMVAALQDAAAEADLLVAAEHLRLARSAMDRLIGRSGIEDMLDSLFSRFCIGK
ncbi:MAG: tRNA uridine-5-carboxymethylaminomethyl(34) synthesis GTPase MnmE [Sphingobium sp.]